MQSVHPNQSQDSNQKKRRNEEATSDGSRRQRREKYTPAACEECKKKKIKCSGDLPCRRCESHDKTCKYIRGLAADGEFVESSSNRCTALEAQVRGLQEHVQQLQSSIEDIRSQILRGNPNDWSQTRHQETNDNGLTTVGRPQARRTSISQPKVKSAPTRPQFIGPTSSDFSFNVANSALTRLGIEPANADTRLESAVTSRRTSPEPTSRDPVNNHNIDPLMKLSLTEVKRMLDVYEDELHPIYPFIDVDEVRDRASELYQELEAGHIGAEVSGELRTCSVDAMVFKLIVATALVVEGAGKSAMGEELLGSIDATLDKSIRGIGIHLKQLQLFTLTSIYHFHCDDEVLAWRTIGIAARIALEMGLHRKESLEENVPDPEKRHWAKRLFYCIYVLDRRWSFGIGLPFALHDSDIDPELPNLDGRVPYLESMVAYGKISSQVWQLVAGFGNKSLNTDQEKVNYLDFQVQRWRESLPPLLQLSITDPTSPESNTHKASTSTPSQSLQRLQVLLYLRANHLRILIHRHNILSSAAISSNREGANLVTFIAKDTIRLLVRMRETSTIYETQQTSYNYFLISALAAIFLAVCHDSAQFSVGCRDEFFSALELLKDLSSHGASAKRLWKSLKGLKSIAPRLGLTPREQRDGEERAASLGGNGSASGRDSEGTFSHQPLVQTTSGLTGPTRAGERVWNVNAAANSNANTGVLGIGDGNVAMNAADFELPDMFYMSSELTNMFEAFGDMQGQVGMDFDVQDRLDGRDISALFGDLL
ncbi:fungal-specific transcription factor domain-containing protein [Cadophora sp. MPI-SDFR-AT-0126]|nr:fungal-specific transcription factor domain-containing protein [Leotiomycetes sp. MPI-SDFR-AT-0126]